MAVSEVTMTVVVSVFDRGGCKEGGAAVMRLAAVTGLELQGGVPDAELLAQFEVDAVDQRGASGDGHFDDGDMTGESEGLGAETPDMEIMDVHNAIDVFDGGADLCELDTARGAFEEDVQSFAHDANRAPKDERGNEEREQGIDPVEVGVENAEATEDDGGGGDGVSQHVDEDGTDIDLAREAPKQGRDEAIHDNACCSDEHHGSGLDGQGRGKAMDGSERDPDREGDEGDGINEGGKDAGPLVPEGLFVGGRAPLEVDGEEGEANGEEIGGVVAGFRDEREGVDVQADEQGGDDVREGRHHGDLKNTADAAVWCGHHVHGLSVSRA